MSEFDKEAERKKLQEKFEKEEQEREVTRKMSDLLLKGATMTNKHCDTCGSPIFRLNEQEFCPTCGGPTTRDQSSGESASNQSPTGTPDGETRAEATAEPMDSSQSGSGITASTRSTADSSPRHDIEEARVALIQTLTNLTKQAQSTTDVGRTRELLAAAREAAEALDALESIGR